jgi:hypothetical protein
VSVERRVGLVDMVGLLVCACVCMCVCVVCVCVCALGLVGRTRPSWPVHSCCLHPLLPAPRTVFPQLTPPTPPPKGWWGHSWVTSGLCNDDLETTECWWGMTHHSGPSPCRQGRKSLGPPRDSFPTAIPGAPTLSQFSTYHSHYPLPARWGN